MTMSELAVVTPSFGPDAELFADLHRSVLRHTGPDVVHHVIVPVAHREIFAAFAGPRCRVWTEPELLPRRYRRLPRRGLWVNAKRPWPPVRGWVMQQAAKIAAAATVDAGVILIADSDAVLVRPTTAERLRVDGRPALYRAPDAIHGGMHRHLLWHTRANSLASTTGRTHCAGAMSGCRLQSVRPRSCCGRCCSFSVDMRRTDHRRVARVH